LIGNHPKGAGCAKGSNKMDMEKIKQKLKEKPAPPEYLDFLEGCLRENETV
jgi:hypothetical protein